MKRKYCDDAIRILIECMQHSDRNFVLNNTLPKLKLLLNEMDSDTSRRKRIVINWLRRSNHVNHH